MAKVAARLAPRYETVGIGGEPERPENHKPPIHEVFKLVSTAVIALGAYFGRAYPGVVIASALVGVVGIYHEQLWNGTCLLVYKRHDQRVAHKSTKQLRRFSREIGKFFDLMCRQNTLAGIMDEISRTDSRLTAAMRTAPADIFNNHWYYLNHRIQNERLTAERFHDAVSEFTDLIRSYTTHCVHPIFSTYAAELSEALSTNEKSRLNGFQQHYVAAIKAYINYVQQLNEELRHLPKFTTGMIFPDPLS